MDLRALALNAQFDERAVRFLLDEVQRIRRPWSGRSQGGRTPRWQRCRRRTSGRTRGGTPRWRRRASRPAPGRLRTASKLGERLARHGGSRNGAGELAELLSVRPVLDAALASVADGQATDVFLLVSLAGGDTPEGKALGRRSDRDVRELGRSARHAPECARTGGAPLLGERPRRAHDPRAGGGPARAGARRRAERRRAGRPPPRHVHVAPWLPSPEYAQGALVRQARAALEGLSTEVDVVRRYRRGRSPLVRDAVRATGRSLDRVMAGDFDLF